jgi:capsular exopolysaccharide synthesis family protein
MEGKLVAMEPVRKEKAVHSAVAPAAHAAQEVAGAVPGAVKEAARFPIDRAQLSKRRVVFPDEPSESARAYKMLRTQILRRARQHKHRVIGITSPMDGDGKTLTIINLALSLAAEPNQTILLLDLDLHRPSVASVFGIEASEGVEASLARGTEIGDLLRRPQGIERLSVLPATALAGGSSELLASERARALLRELRERYDDRLILIDLPPVLLTDDVLALAPLLDAVLLVVSERRTRREDVLRATELLADVPLLGAVLNQAHEVERRVY